MKKLWYLFVIFVLAAVLLTSCNQPVENPEEPSGSLPQGTEQPTEPETPPVEDSNTSVTGSVSGFTYRDAYPCRTTASLQGETLCAIGSYEQMQVFQAEYFSEGVLRRYDEAYFDSKSLAVCFFPDLPSSAQVIIRDVQVSNGKLVVTAGKHLPDTDLTTTRTACYFIEIEGDVVLNENSGLELKTVAMDSLDPPSGLGTPVAGTVTGFTCWNENSYTSAYPGFHTEPEIYAIGTYEQWQAFCYRYYPQFLNKYDSAYFNGHSVAVYRREEPSGSIQVTVQDVQVKDGKLAVIVGRYSPEVQTQDMKPWCIFVEIEGDAAIDEYADAVIEFVALDQPIAS
jgi:hypothetical protein